MTTTGRWRLLRSGCSRMASSYRARIAIGQPHTNGDTAHLLTLVADLTLEPLTTSQKLVVAELQRRLMALAAPQNESAKPIDWIVNDLMTPLREEWALS